MSGLDARVLKALDPVRDSPAFQLDLHLRCERGITVIFGPSGSGKTLFLNCVGGFARPDEGRILLDDQIYFDASTNVNLPPEARRCAYIFQDHALFPHMTVRENLRFAASLPVRGSGRLHTHRRINELLESFDLIDLANRKPAQLSGGQRQRAALARILITEPKLILLDEPSRGLDARLRQSFWDLLRNLRQSVSTPILLVSHDAEEFCQLADYLAVFDAGKCLQSGPLDVLLRQPASVRTAQLIGLHNIAPAQIEALDPVANLSRLRVPGGDLEIPYLSGHLIGDRGFVCVRHSETSLAAQERGPNTLILRVESRQPSPLGVRLALGGGFNITVSEARANEIHSGNTVTVSVPPSAVTFLAR